MVFIFGLVWLVLANSVLFWWFNTQLFADQFLVTGGNEAYIWLAVCFAVLNTFVKPVVKVLTLPIKWLTLGLFGFILNGVLLWGLEMVIQILAISGVGLEIQGLATYILAGLILSVANGVLSVFR
jgi:putative membrane protein